MADESKVAGEFRARGPYGMVNAKLRRRDPEGSTHELSIEGIGAFEMEPEDIVLALSASGYYGSEHIGSRAAQRVVQEAGDAARSSVLAQLEERGVKKVGGGREDFANAVAEAVRGTLLFVTGLVREESAEEFERRHLQPVPDPGGQAA